LRETSFKH